MINNVHLSAKNRADTLLHVQQLPGITRRRAPMHVVRGAFKVTGRSKSSWSPGGGCGEDDLNRGQMKSLNRSLNLLRHLVFKYMQTPSALARAKPTEFHPQLQINGDRRFHLYDKLSAESYGFVWITYLSLIASVCVLDACFKNPNNFWILKWQMPLSRFGVTFWRLAPPGGS